MGATGLCDNIEDNIQNNVCTQSASPAPNNLHENGSVTCNQIRQPDTCLLLPLQTCVHTKQITVRGLYIWCPCCKHTRFEPRPCQTLACTFESDNLCFKISLAGRVDQSKLVQCCEGYSRRDMHKKTKYHTFIPRGVYQIK